MKDLFDEIDVAQLPPITEAQEAAPTPAIQDEGSEIPTSDVETVEQEPPVEVNQEPSAQAAGEEIDYAKELEMLTSKPEPESKFKSFAEVLGKEVKDETELLQEFKSKIASYEDKIKSYEDSRINSIDSIKELVMLESHNPDAIPDEAYIRAKFPQGEEGEAEFKEYLEATNHVVLRKEAREAREYDKYMRDSKIAEIKNREMSQKKAVDEQLTTFLKSTEKVLGIPLSEADKASVYQDLRKGVSAKHIDSSGNIDVKRAAYEQLVLKKLPEILESAKKAAKVEGKKEIIQTSSNVTLNRKEQPPRQSPVDDNPEAKLKQAVEDMFTYKP